MRHEGVDVDVHYPGTKTVNQYLNCGCNALGVLFSRCYKPPGRERFTMLRAERHRD